MRILLALLAFLVADLMASETTSSGSLVNADGCQCQIDAPLKVRAGRIFTMTVHLLSDKTINKEYTIELKGTADARFDNAKGPKVKVQKPCPSVGTYTVHPGSRGARKIEVWVGTALCKEIEVVNLDLLSLEYTSDLQVLLDKKDNHKSGGKRYTAPEWVKGGVNNPIVHVKKTKISLRLTVQYDALSDDAHKTEGRGGALKWLHFGPANGALKPGRNIIDLTGEAELPDMIMNNAGGGLNWTIAISPGEYTFTTGPHRIYVVAAAPYGSAITEWRIDWATRQCDGLGKADDCLRKFAQAVKFSLSNYVDNVEDPCWSQAAGVKADCISQVSLWNRALAMLGWPQGDVRYCFPTLGKGAKVSARWNDWVSGPRGQLGFFASDVDPRAANAGRFFNNFEATLLYNGNYWLGGGNGANHPTPLQVMKAVCARSIWLKNGKYSLAEDW